MTATTQTITDLHHNILIDPRDLGLRMVYADALQESGDEQDWKLGQLIRLQIAKEPEYFKPASDADDHHQQWKDLCYQQNDLLSMIDFGIPKDWMVTARIQDRSQWLLYSRSHQGGWQDQLPIPILVVRNGLPWQIICDLGTFCNVCSDWFKTMPIESVMLLDREPRFLSDVNARTRSWNWVSSRPATIFREPENIPKDILSWLADFDTPEDAHKFLDMKCVTWGRELAGLPKLKD